MRGAQKVERMGRATASGLEKQRNPNWKVFLNIFVPSY
jgi:hypothetical protein